GLQLWAGALIGLALAATFGVLFARGTLRISLKPFFSLTTAVLLLVALQLIAGGLHELSEALVLPASRTEMALVGPIVKNELLLSTRTLAFAIGWRLLGAGGEPEAPNTQESGPAARLARAAAARERTWRRSLAVLGVVVVGVLAASFAS